MITTWQVLYPYKTWIHIQTHTFLPAGHSAHFYLFYFFVEVEAEMRQSIISRHLCYSSQYQIFLPARDSLPNFL